MQVSRMSEAPLEPLNSPLFTSSDVRRRDLAAGSKDYAASEVHFGTGVRNKFHIHESDQLLIVTSGRGLIVTDAEKRTLEPGDVVLAPAGEKHWHGAAPDSEFAHITITRAGAGMTQVEE